MTIMALGYEAFSRYKNSKEEAERQKPDNSLEETLGCLQQIQSQIVNDEMMNLTLRTFQGVQKNIHRPTSLNWEHFGVSDLRENPQVQARHTAQFITSILRSNPEILESEFITSLQGFINQQGYGRIISKSFELRVCIGLVDSYLKHRDKKAKSHQSTLQKIWKLIRRTS